MVIDGGYFTIRSVGERELEAILGVYRQCEDFLSLGPVPHASEEMVREDLASSRQHGGTFCGILAGDEMMGVVDFVAGGFEGAARDACLLLLMIAAPFRGRGLGRDVVGAVEAEIMKNPSVRFIRAGVQTNNKRAVSFWARRGYRIAGGPQIMPDTTVVYPLVKAIG